MMTILVKQTKWEKLEGAIYILGQMWKGYVDEEFTYKQNYKQEKCIKVNITKPSTSRKVMGWRIFLQAE